MDLSKLAVCFDNNYYLSKEYISFCRSVTSIRSKGNILNNKNISIHMYSDSDIKKMIQNNISFLSVTLEDNSKSKDPSLIEYPLWLHRSYEQALKDYDKTFRKYSRRAKLFDYDVKILRNVDASIINAVYALYTDQMKRLKSFVFPKYYFSDFMKLSSSLLFLIYHNKKIVGYSFCFENKDNLYTSIGGADKDYFDRYINYKLYDEKIKYASKKCLNIHMGIGLSGSGYNRFKKRTGAILLRCKKYPDEDDLLKKLLPITKYEFVGWVFRALSRLSPKKIIFLLMPFT